MPTAIRRTRLIMTLPSLPVLDVLAANVLLLTLMPLLMILGACVVLSSPGPMLIRRMIPTRDGRCGYVTEFRVWRVCNPHDTTRHVFGQPDTRIGRVLRATRFERLPGLLDVRSRRHRFGTVFGA